MVETGNFSGGLAVFFLSFKDAAQGFEMSTNGPENPKFH
jgi:hypothetical protein